MAKRNQPAECVRLERCPGYDDPRALLEHGIAMIVRVSQCDDPALALKAGQWLVTLRAPRSVTAHCMDAS